MESKSWALVGLTAPQNIYQLLAGPDAQERTAVPPLSLLLTALPILGWGQGRAGDSDFSRGFRSNSKPGEVLAPPAWPAPPAWRGRALHLQLPSGWAPGGAGLPHHDP